jgi:peptide/nickel transport system permease protein
MKPPKFKVPLLFTFLLSRGFAAAITILIITAVIYAIVMLIPMEARAAVYLPDEYKPKSDEQIHHMIDVLVREHGLDDPYPVQYFRWLTNLLKGDWGWSPNIQQDVLEALLTRTPSTVELTLASLLIFLPLGLLFGAYSGWKKESLLDRGFRLTSFIGISIPPFLLGLLLMSIFYAGLNWFPPGDVSIESAMVIRDESFTSYTHLITIDGLLNGRPDITIDALKHLILPAISVSLVHLATLGLVTRSSMIEELSNDYIRRAKSIGLSNQGIIWKHGFRNAMLPGLTSTALSAAALIMGVYVIEIVFNRHGVSELISYMLVNVRSSQVEAALPAGFAVYSALAVLPIMLLLDILQALSDQRIQIGEK